MKVRLLLGNRNVMGKNQNIFYIEP